MVFATCVEIEDQVGGFVSSCGPACGPASDFRGTNAWPPDLLIPSRLGEVSAFPQHR